MNIVKRILRKIYKLIFGNKVPALSQYPFTSNTGITITHISAYGNGNMGDTYLPIALRNLFNFQIGVKKWINKSVYKIVSSTDIKIYNKSDLVVIGGGGLFLKDTNPNDLSGWQWSCSIDMLNQINSPLIAFAIGYNRFRNQDEFEPIFTKHLNKFIEKAEFVGIRNHGSIEKLKNYLYTEDLKKKLSFQPCMTTLTSLLYPQLYPYEYKEDFIALNCAFDRQQMRNSDDEILKKIARVIQKLSQTTAIKVYAHSDGDGKIRPYLDELSIKYEYIKFNKVKPMLIAYAKPKLVIGMRGHAQMIPFGCNTPILSIVSHDKMQWFLDDIHHPEWGVDVLDPLFESKLFTKAEELYKSTQKLIPLLKEEQKYLWTITQQNMKYIKSLIKKNETSQNNR